MGNRASDQKKEASGPLFREAFPCAYFNEGRPAAIEYLFIDERNMDNFHFFLSKGYRRLGRIFYRNVCGQCSACLPLRVEIESFKVSRSQERTLKQNRDVRIEIASTALTDEKIALYRKYLSGKHGREESGKAGADESILALHHGYPHIIEMDYYLNRRLIGVGIVDNAEDSLSSNYFYYDTDYAGRRLGVFSILSEISLARFMGKKYYYLGFYIAETRKMSYKKQFRPNQIYENEKWRDFIR